MRRLLVVALPTFVVFLAGCGITTLNQTYDASLIRQLGAGSNLVASVAPTLEAQAKGSNSFSDPRTSRATTLLIDGQLSKLTEADLVGLATANRRSATRFPLVLDKLDSLASSLVNARIDANAHRNLSTGAKHFIAAWNNSLTADATQARELRQALTTFAPGFNEFQALLRAAYDTAQLHSTVQFDNVTRQVINDILPRYRRVQGTIKEDAAGTPAEQKLIELVDSNQEAQAIVSKVNEHYPNGSLAQEFKRP
ncbi:MAG: hypothetical protein WAL63_13325 [Solirubrobacteraceae bacterium]